MTETEFQVVKSVGFVVAFVVALSIQRMRPRSLIRGSWSSNGPLWAINAAALGLLCAGCACTASRWASDEGIGLLNTVSVSEWVSIPISIVGLDLVSYGWHRANHRFSTLWRFHQVHHSDSAFTVTTALRFHPGELLLALPLRLGAVAALGVSIPGVIGFELVFAFANFIEHGDIDLPRELEQGLSRVFVVPALHRRHHGQQQQLLDSNFGTIFSVWDRLFGSFGESSSAVEVDVGLPGLQDQLGPLALSALPLRGIFRGEA